MKRSPSSLARHPRSREPFGQNIVSQRDDVVSGREDVAMHVADQVADACRFGQIARMGNQHILVCGAHHVRHFGIVVQELPRMKDGACRQFQGEYDAVGRLEEPPNTPPIDGAHREFDDRQAGWRLGLGMDHANGNGRS
jgi:hypothetical protein